MLGATTKAHADPHLQPVGHGGLIGQQRSCGPHHLGTGAAKLSLVPIPFLEEPQVAARDMVKQVVAEEEKDHTGE